MTSYEIVTAAQGSTPAADAKVQRCDAVAGDPQATQCSLTLKRGGWDVFFRAVNDAGASDWSQGPSVSIYRCTDADGLAGVCEVFDTGPGGGFVFYNAGSRQPWGQYLEAAPKGWSGSPDDPGASWCAGGWLPGYKSRLATEDGIGLGAANTRLIIENCGTDNAAGLSAAYRGGGKSDWFLASKDELQKMYGLRGEIGTIPGDDNYKFRAQYWCSCQSQGEGYLAYEAGTIAFGGYGKGLGVTTDKISVQYVRPVRAF